MMKPSLRTMKPFPLDVAGTTAFGRFPKISSEETYNMVLANNWMVNYAGWRAIKQVPGGSQGRGIFSSTRLGKMIVSIDNKIFTASSYVSNSNNLSLSFIGYINSFNGDVFIDENNAGQIAICDQRKIYIYDYANGRFGAATLPEGFIPSYVCFQDGYFIAANSAGATWALSAPNDGFNWFWGASGEPVLGGIQTKPTLGVGVIRVPGHGNLLFVFGQTVTEDWTDQGKPGFPYQKATSINVDYGCINAATIAGLDDIVAWVGANEQAGITIMYAKGSQAQQFPDDDGINYRLSLLKHPSKCSAFFVRLAGRIFYQVTWYDPEDNLSLIFDFSAMKIYTATRENGNFHIARRVAFFNNTCYFVSFIDGNIYEFSPDITVYDYGIGALGNPQVYEIPRIRICKTIRLPGPSRSVCNLIEFTLQQGTDPKNYGALTYQPRVDMSLSRDGGVTFGAQRPYPINPIGRRANRINWFGNGAQNELTPQFRFWGMSSFLATNGYVGVYQ